MPKRTCATMQNYFARLDAYPDYRANRLALHESVRAFDWDKDLAPTEIPVVVHIVYKDAQDNLSDGRIHRQIAALNDDFNARNADLVDVPAPFKPMIGDAGLTFHLASFDPLGAPTTGITRTQTDLDVFSIDDENVKFTYHGGIDAWDTSRFLNIWVCQLKVNLGYATFPGGDPLYDGVVIHTGAFGVGDGAEAPFDLGRTLTHEVGHYLNLEHIWGYCGNGVCEDSDFVDDTPNQFGPNSYDDKEDQPRFPHYSCEGEANGDMFMNFMDYGHDDLLVMFSRGQVARMHAALTKSRTDLGKSAPPPITTS